MKLAIQFEMKLSFNLSSISLLLTFVFILLLNHCILENPKTNLIQLILGLNSIESSETNADADPEIIDSRDVIRVGGSIFGLSGGTIRLSLNDGLSLVDIAEDGNFIFPDLLEKQSNYSVEILQKPTAMHCAGSSTFGSVFEDDILNVDFYCQVSDSYQALQNGIIRVGSAPINPIIENPNSLPALSAYYSGSIENAGSDPGLGNLAKYNSPKGMETDGYYLYIFDETPGIIRKLDPSFRKVINLEIPVTKIEAMAIDGVYTYILSAQSGIRKLNRYHLGTGNFSTIAGGILADDMDGIGTDAGFSQVYGMAVSGSNIYTIGNNTLRKIDLNSKKVTTIAGSPGNAGNMNGSGQNVQFSGNRGIIMTNSKTILISSINYHNIRKVDLSTNPVSVSTFVGSPSGEMGYSNAINGIDSLLKSPTSMTADEDTIYVIDSGNFKIRKISLIQPYEVSDYFGCMKNPVPIISSGIATNELFCSLGDGSLHNPNDIIFADNKVFVSEQSKHIIRKID
ncbi:hypothetical protein [Leptospira sp. GIMC2001]|uniref:hypothetical protein n=1 Tax=Leptospira sp. GIMC2001 TaxID=1513297 RepID=UPI00234A2EED|nr:hypothetical protein [Leptospira sp. GIMC2001]WCL50594.1 hypothetical protein O4O04_07190 [Leptospira sp. GIMC2001]